LLLGEEVGYFVEEFSGHGEIISRIGGENKSLLKRTLHSAGLMVR
jgi:hypothetical protein